jgi:predicted nucleic acid-binding protein
MNGIADTGFIVAFLNRDDRHHAWAAELAKNIGQPWLTCEAVLAEAAFQTGSCERVLDLIRDRMIQLAFDSTANFVQLLDLAERYEDRHPDFADLCLIRMSELYPQHIVVTLDEKDFRVYRRYRRDVIPILCPFH